MVMEKICPAGGFGKIRPLHGLLGERAWMAEVDRQNAN
jgi:hypothetical protein